MMAAESTPGKRHVLVVEDNDADVFLLREAAALHKLGVELHVVENGALAIASIAHADQDATAPCPCLCLLDMNLPLRGGADVLRHVRRSRRMASVPVIVMTSSRSQPERDEIMRLGASAFFHKPISYDEFMTIGALMRSLLPEATAG
jgi:CheY-like chemotaxis protein